MLDARQYMGFRIRHLNEKISFIGLWGMEVNGKRQQPSVFGLDATGKCVFDIVLDKVLEVVATFDGQALVDLGPKHIAGHHEPPPVVQSPKAVIAALVGVL
ncbi:hypothetical protein BDW75DRAFT_238151 [Aspergillus navahoensis]